MIAVFRLANKLEDFCCSGDFTQFIGDFQNQHAMKFVYGEDQPLE